MEGLFSRGFGAGFILAPFSLWGVFMAIDISVFVPADTLSRYFRFEEQGIIALTFPQTRNL